MEIVIKIPEEIYSHTQEYEVGVFNQENDTKLFMAIKNGTPLPEHHGRIIDETQIHKCGWNYIKHHAKTDAPTIIEAEGSDSE